MSKSYALSVNTLLVFDMELINVALFLSAESLFFLSFLSSPATVRVHLRTIYASL